MTKKQNIALWVAILASFVAFLDGSVINVALPAISQELGGGLSVQQWIVNAYLITLGSLMLVAGSLSDLFGRKKILTIGLFGFAITSLLCAVAPTASFLIIARLLQGVAGALLVPSSLALIISSFSAAEQGRAIGKWTAWTGIAFVIGPLLGGFLVDIGSWRMIFAINIIPVAITLWLLGLIKQKEEIKYKTKVDFIGAGLCSIGLGGPVYALIEQSRYGWDNPIIYLPFIIGIACFITFILYERITPQPMLPLNLFKIRNFWVGNVATVAIYGALAVATFLITVFVQQFGGYSALQAGLTLLPVTIIMFVLSPKFGALAGKYGPRAFMALGPIVAGAGFLTMSFVDQSVNYWSQLLPGVLIFGVGLAMTVAPLTSAVLGAINPSQAGIGSAVNNALARVAGLITIATVGIIIGSSLDLEGFRRGMLAMALLLGIGGVISAIGVKNHKKTT